MTTTSSTIITLTLEEISPSTIRGCVNISKELSLLENIRITFNGYYIRKLHNNRAFDQKRKFINKSISVVNRVNTATATTTTTAFPFEIGFSSPLPPSIKSVIDGRGEFGVEYFIRADIMEEEVFDRLVIRVKGDLLSIVIPPMPATLSATMQEEMIESIVKERNTWCCCPFLNKNNTIKMTLTINRRAIEQDIKGYIHISNTQKKRISSITITLIQLIQTSIPLRKLTIKTKLAYVRFYGLRSMEEDGAPFTLQLPPPSTSTTTINDLFEIQHYVEVRIYGDDDCINIMIDGEKEITTRTAFFEKIKIY